MRIHYRGTAAQAGIVAAVVLGLGLGACAPLAQAPLVYSSKHTIGLDVSTTSAETPGVGISIGYKSLDVAYVPVAVAANQHCMLVNANIACNPQALDIKVLMATSAVADSTKPQAQRLVEAMDALAKAQAALGQKQAQLTSLTATRDADVEKAKDSDAAKAALDRINADTSANEASKSVLVEREKTAREAGGRRESNQAAVDAATGALATASKDVEVAQAAKDKAESVQLSSAENSRQDAFSVYGSFDGNTGAGTQRDKPKAAATDTLQGGTTAVPDATAGAVTGELGVGKVFSTGIASQFLTDGIRARSTAACMDSVSRTTTLITATAFSDEVKADLIRQAITACQPTNIH